MVQSAVQSVVQFGTVWYTLVAVQFEALPVGLSAPRLEGRVRTDPAPPHAKRWARSVSVEGNNGAFVTLGPWYSPNCTMVQSGLYQTVPWYSLWYSLKFRNCSGQTARARPFPLTFRENGLTENSFARRSTRPWWAGPRCLCRSYQTKSKKSNVSGIFQTVPRLNCTMVQSGLGI